MYQVCRELTDMPPASSVTAKEALYFCRTAGARAMLCTSGFSGVANEIAATVRQSRESSFFALPIAEVLGKSLIPIGNILISADHELALSGAGLVIFTSGTTGPPKGALKKRSFFTNNSEAFARWWQLDETDTVLHVLPVHHSTGLGVTFLAPLISGTSIEFNALKRFTAAEMWSRWMRGGLTIFSGVPTMYQRMMQHFEDEVVPKRSPQEIQRHIDAAKQFRLLLCGTSALPFSLQTKWINLLGGQNRVLERYGGTEFSGVFSVLPGDMGNPDVSSSRRLVSKRHSDLRI